VVDLGMSTCLRSSRLTMLEVLASVACDASPSLGDRRILIHAAGLGQWSAIAGLRRRSAMIESTRDRGPQSNTKAYCAHPYTTPVHTLFFDVRLNNGTQAPS